MDEEYMYINVYEGSIKEATYLCALESVIPRKEAIPRKHELLTISNETYIINNIQYDCDEGIIRIYVNIYDWE